MIPLYDDNPTRRFPVITVLLIAVNVVVFLFIQPKGGEDEVEFLYGHAAVPCEVVTGEPVHVVNGSPTCSIREAPEPFPHKNVYLAVLISMFLHANWLHIAGNMLFLWIFGNNVEDKMGPIVYLIFYLVGGLVAALAHILLFRDSTLPVVGASGAIAAVMGAYLVRFPKARVLTLIPLFLILTFWLPAWVVLGLWFISQFLISAANSGVATAAHIGGFAFGVLIGLLFLRGQRIREDRPPPYTWTYR